MQTEIDDEVIKVLQEQMEVAKNILNDKRELVELMVERLLDKKTLMFRDIYEILGDRPFDPPTNFKRYLIINRFLEEFHRSIKKEQEYDNDNEEGIENNEKDVENNEEDIKNNETDPLVDNKDENDK